MALTSRQVSVTTGAAIELSDGTAATLRQSYELWIVNHDATNPVYIGASTVTSSTGAKLVAGGSTGISLAFGETIWARATGGTVVVGVVQSKF